MLPKDILAHHIIGRISAEEWQSLATISREWSAAVDELTKAKIPCRYKHLDVRSDTLRQLAVLLPARPSCFCARLVNAIYSQFDTPDWWRLFYDCFYCPLTVASLFDALLRERPQLFATGQYPDFLKELMAANKRKFQRDGGFTVHALGFSFAIDQLNTKMCNTITLLDCAYIVKRWRRKLVADNKYLAWFLIMIYYDAAPRSIYYRCCTIKVALLLLTIRVKINIDDTGEVGEALRQFIDYAAGSDAAIDRFIRSRIIM